MNPKLFFKVYSYQYIHNLKYSIKSIILPDWCCNDLTYTEFDFSRFIYLKSLTIGTNSFCSVRTFILDKLDNLKSLEIGFDSFTLVTMPIFYCLTPDEQKEVGDSSKSFHISNCNSLESIVIDSFSFCDFAGGFELSNLNSLKSITIGNMKTESSNFLFNSFVLQGTRFFLLIECLDLPELKTLELGVNAFMNAPKIQIKSKRELRGT